MADVELDFRAGAPDDNRPTINGPGKKTAHATNPSAKPVICSAQALRRTTRLPVVRIRLLLRRWRRSDPVRLSPRYRRTMGLLALNRLMSMLRDRRRRPIEGRSKPPPFSPLGRSVLFISAYVVCVCPDVYNVCLLPSIYNPFIFCDEPVTCWTVS
jgi:hypothetical protein